MLSVTTDWLEFTVLNSPITKVYDLLGLTHADFLRLSSGRYGYNHQLKWKLGNMFILVNGPKSGELDINEKITNKTGIHVVISGQGCRQYSVKHNIVDLIKSLYKDDNAKFTRIDLAIDDIESEVINYNRIHKAALEGNFTSIWSKWYELNSRKVTSGQYLGRTIYFGSKASDLFCRVYDKSLERMANKQEVASGWTRLELVYRKKRSNQVVKHIVEDNLTAGQIMRGTLRRYLRFLEPSEDSNKSRWPSADWWDKALEDVNKLSLAKAKPRESTIEEMMNWVTQQMGPTLAAVTKAHEGDMTWLTAAVVEGSKRLTKKHERAIENFIAQKRKQDK